MPAYDALTQTLTPVLSIALASLDSPLLSVASALANLPDFWSFKLFEKYYWVPTMFGVRVALCLLGALLLIAEVRSRDRPQRASKIFAPSTSMR